MTARGVGLVDFSVIPHFEHENHLDASLANAEKWAARIPAPTYAIDEQTAIKVVDGAVEVISEGTGSDLTPCRARTHLRYSTSRTQRSAERRRSVSRC